MAAVNVTNSIHELKPIGAGSYGYTTVADSAALLSAFTATGGALTRLAITTCVAVFVESGAVRFRLDGTDPTTTVGDLMQTGKRYYFSSEEYDALKVIRDGSTSAVVHIHQLG